jgi:uncharacterized protein YxjI
MNYPLQLNFKKIALAPQIYVRDASGSDVCYVKQQLFKLKEKIRIFTDPSMRTLLAEINADSIIDFSATYTFTDPAGNPFGAVRRKGLRSLWRTHYEVLEGGSVSYQLREANPWSKMADGIFGEIPILGILSGYLFHPRYHVIDRSGAVVFEVRKRAAFFEGRFEIRKNAEVSNDITIVMSILMMVLLERSRG